MIGKRQFLAGLGVMVTSSALAQIHSATPPGRKPVTQRRAKTTKLFKAPEFYPTVWPFPITAMRASGSGSRS